MLHRAVVKMPVVLIIFTSLVLAPALSAGESGPSLARLTKFVGKYPSGYADEHGKTVKKAGILDDRTLRQILLQTLGKDRYAILIKRLLP